MRPDRGDAPGRAEVDRARRARPGFADASAAEASGAPAEPQRAGEAWFQFTVDGRVGNGAGDAVADSAESIEARRVSFARYSPRATRFGGRVDGTSLLQVGTCELDVSALARRGRDAADALVEAVVRDHRDDVADVVSAVHSDPKPQPPPIGALLVRLINVGDAAAAAAAESPSRRKRARRFARRRIPEASSRRRYAPAR